MPISHENPDNLDTFFLNCLPIFLIRRFGTANWLAIIIICWGAIAIGMGFVHSWQLLAVCRALLGIFEVPPKKNFVNNLGWLLPRLCLSHQLLVQTL